MTVISTDTRFQPIITNKSTLQNTAISNGSVYFVDDTKELFVDFDSTRIEISDILILSTEAERTSVLFTPLNKFYFVLETQMLWLYRNGSWINVVTAIKQDGISGTIINRYGTCSTAAATAAKEMSITTGTFNLEAGARISIKFTNTNTADNPTLNVNSTGAKNIYCGGSQITTGNNKGLLSGIVDFIYDGTQWNLIGDYLDSTDSVTSGDSRALTSGGAYTNLIRRLSTSTATGSTSQGVYIDANGQVQTMTYELNKTVPSDAVFTDTTYSVMTGADGTDPGTSGLTPAPAATDNDKFLRGDGTWAQVTSTTDTKNTAGATDTSAKIYLVGAETQSANPQTYSQDTAFVDTSGRLNSANPSASEDSTVVATTQWVNDKAYLTASDVTSTYSATGTDPVNGTAVKSAIDGAISAVYKPAGSIPFSSRPALSASVLGNVYNITDSFTTTADFVEGAGNTYPAGTNIVVVDIGTSSAHTYKFDVLAGFVDLSGYQPVISDLSTIRSNASTAISEIGDLTDLITTDKSDLVEAINEVKHDIQSLNPIEIEVKSDTDGIIIIGTTSEAEVISDLQGI